MVPLKFRVFLETRAGLAVDVDAVLAWLKQQSSEHLLVVQHDADSDDARPHYHALLFSDRNVQSLRVSLLKAVPSVKANYSLQDMPDSAVESYSRYMCHGKSRGDLVVIIYASLAKYNEAWAAVQNRAFWDSRTAFKQDQSKKSEDILATCLQLAKEQRVTSIHQVADIVMDEYQSRKKTFHFNHMRHQIVTIWHAMGGPEQVRDVRQLLLNGIEFFSTRE